MAKSSFLIHIDSLAILDDMTDEQAGKLFKAMHAFQKGENTELDLVTKMAFVPFKNQFLRDNASYEKVVSRNKINGSKGGKPSGTQSEPNKPTGLSGKRNNPVTPDKDKDSDNDSKKDNVSEDKTRVGEVHKKTCDFFSVSEMRSPRIFMQLLSAIKLIEETARLPDYEKQLQAYIEYKKVSEERTCNVVTWMWGRDGGTIETGHWCREDWEKKFKNYTPKNNGNNRKQSGEIDIEALARTSN